MKMHLKVVASLWLGIVAMAAWCSAPLSAETVLPAEVSFFEETFGDMQEELALVAEEDKKALLIMFETDDCPWCLRMKQTVLNRQRVQDYFKTNFRSITIDAEGGAPIVDFEGNDTIETKFATGLLRVRATPVFAFFDASGQLLTKYTGTTKDADDFLLLGEYVVDGHYKDTKFSKFRRERAGKQSS